MKVSSILDAAWSEPACSATPFGEHLRLVNAVSPALRDTDVGSSYAELAATYRPDNACRVTAVVLTRDEEQRIGGCLGALADDCDDVLLVDAASEDATLRVARSSASEVAVVQRPWTDDFADQRNAAFVHAGGDVWLAHIDADERLDPGSAGHLRSVLTALDHMVPDSDLVVSPHIVDTTSRESYTNTQRVLRARSDLRFRGRLHERPFDSDGSAPPWVEVAVTFHHTGYEPEVIESRNKRETYARILGLCRDEEPENPKWRFYSVRDGLVGLVPDPETARALFRELHDALGLYEQPGLTDYETERYTDSLVLLCDLALRFGGGREIGDLVPLLDARGRRVEAAYYASFAEFSALLGRASGLLDRLAATDRFESPGNRRLLGQSYDLQALLALTCGRYDEVPGLVANARARGSGSLAAGTLESLQSYLGDWADSSAAAPTASRHTS